MKGKAQNIHELTRIEAFLLSEKAGHPSHMHDYFWAQAEAIVRQRAAIVDHAVKASGGKPTKAGKATVAKPKVAAAGAKKSAAKTGATKTKAKVAAPAVVVTPEVAPKAVPKKKGKSK